MAGRIIGSGLLPLAILLPCNVMMSWVHSMQVMKNLINVPGLHGSSIVCTVDLNFVGSLGAKCPILHVLVMSGD